MFFNCVECGKQLPALLPCFAKIRKFCSKSCGSKYSQAHPTEGTIKYRAEFGLRVAKHPKRLEELKKAIQREDWLKNRTGDKNPRWQGGISFEPYTPEFNKQIKKYVHMRWQYTCVLCKKKGDLTVHHIDYNKKNNSINNFVTYLHGICLGYPEEKNIAELIQH